MVCMYGADRSKFEYSYFNRGPIIEEGAESYSGDAKPQTSEVGWNTPAGRRPRRAARARPRPRGISRVRLRTPRLLRRHGRGRAEEVAMAWIRGHPTDELRTAGPEGVKPVASCRRQLPRIGSPGPPLCLFVALRKCALGEPGGERRGAPAGCSSPLDSPTCDDVQRSCSWQSLYRRSDAAPHRTAPKT